MAKIITVGLDPGAAQQLGKALGPENHQIAHKPKSSLVDDVIEADIVFVDGDGKQYLPLLRLLRAISPPCPLWWSPEFPKPRTGLMRSKRVPRTIAPRRSSLGK